MLQLFFFQELSNPEVLEAMAVREGLNLAQDLNLPRIRLASDCLAVIKAIKEENLVRYCHILREIKSMAADMAEATFVHENRMSNKEPHLLARRVLSSPIGRYVWFVNPPERRLYFPYFDK